MHKAGGRVMGKVKQRKTIDQIEATVMSELLASGNLICSLDKAELASSGGSRIGTAPGLAVVTCFTRELDWLTGELRKALGEFIDDSNEGMFYDRLGDAVARYQDSLGKRRESLSGLTTAVIEEARKIAKEGLG